MAIKILLAICTSLSVYGSSVADDAPHPKA